MKRHSKVPYIILTFILIMIAQALSQVIGQFWSDTLTNFILIMSVMMFDTIPCVVIAFICPFVAKICGLSAMPISLLSIVAISNIMFITVYTVAFQIFASKSIYQKLFTWGVSVIISAFIKYEMLSIIAGKVLLNFLEINTPVIYRFDSIQFYSALLAGTIASFIVKPIKDKLDI